MQSPSAAAAAGVEPAARGIRFQVMVQRNRALVFTLAIGLALVFRALGLVEARWHDILLVGAIADASALAFGWLARRGLHRRLPFRPELVWLPLDIALCSWGVAMTGGEGSPWVPWYLGAISAAAFVRGQLAAFLAFLGSTAGYLVALAAAGDLIGPGAALGAVAFMASLYAASFFFLRGVGKLEEKRGEVVAMRDEGRRKIEELTRLTAALEQRTRELGEVNTRLREADRLRSQFLANVSHELRTPLNSIIGFSEILQSRLSSVLDERQRRFLGYIHHAGEQLLGVINDILDLSKIEAGQGELVGERVSPRLLVEGVCTVLRSTAEKRGVRLRVEVPVELPTLQADAARLKQVVYHLLANAIKFSHPDSEVWVRARRVEAERSPLGRDSLALAVEDHGIGIEPADRELIFEAFRQVDGTASREFQGAGLGLAIVERFVELHAGTVTLDSAVGKGSTFTVHLPLDAAGAPAEVEIPPLLGDGDRVLVVEDDPAAYATIARHLAEGGYAPVRARGGEQALELARRLQPVAVTLDLVLPGTDGLAVLRRLRADEETADLPVIVISVLDNRELGLTLGADDYFVKPVDRDALLRRLGELVPRTPGRDTRRQARARQRTANG
jgi:signal transduction histidine kinase/ActR/RegA family two-component response regulator